LRGIVWLQSQISVVMWVGWLAGRAGSPGCERMAVTGVLGNSVQSPDCATSFADAGVSIIPSLTVSRGHCRHLGHGRGLLRFFLVVKKAQKLGAGHLAQHGCGQRVGLV
jgi:hypothetical protein